MEIIETNEKQIQLKQQKMLFQLSSGVVSICWWHFGYPHPKHDHPLEYLRGTNSGI